MADLNTTLADSMAADAVDNLDTLEIRDSDDNVLVSFSITWGSDGTGVQEVQSTPVESTAGDDGDADNARFYDSGASGEEITGLTVGTSGTDVTIDNTSISSGQTVNLTSASITMPTTLQ